MEKLNSDEETINQFINNFDKCKNFAQKIRENQREQNLKRKLKIILKEFFYYALIIENGFLISLIEEKIKKK